MELKNLLTLNAVVFGLAGALHLLRVLAGWQLQIGNYMVMETISWGLVVLAACLVWWNYQAMSSKKTRSSARKSSRKVSKRKPKRRRKRR